LNDEKSNDAIGGVCRHPVRSRWFHLGRRKQRGMAAGPPAPPTLSIVNNGDGTVTVTFEGKLQAAASVNGPWEDVEGATSPLTLQPDQSATFARAVK
jgi:hypothetical protein